MTDVLSKLFGDQDRRPNVAARLGGTRTLVYMALLNLSELRGKSFDATVGELAVLTGLAPRTIRYAVAELRRMKFLHYWNAAGSSWRLVLLEDPFLPTQAKRAGVLVS